MSNCTGVLHSDSTCSTCSLNKEEKQINAIVTALVADEVDSGTSDAEVDRVVGLIRHLELTMQSGTVRFVAELIGFAADEHRTYLAKQSDESVLKQLVRLAPVRS